MNNETESGWGDIVVLLFILACILLGGFFSFRMHHPALNTTSQNGLATTTLMSEYFCYGTGEQMYATNMADDELASECKSEVSARKATIQKEINTHKKWCAAHTPKELTLDEYLTCQDL